MLKKSQTKKGIKYRKPSKNWKNNLTDKSSFIYICISEFRYQPKGSFVLVFEFFLRKSNKEFNDKGEYQID